MTDMAREVKPRRPYRSEVRLEQAERTRERVLDAAAGLFQERGYEGASVAAIARAAGVSDETVYAGFGTKRALLGELVQRAVRGGDPRPVPEQDEPRALAAETDQREQLRRFAGDIARRLERAAPLAAVVAGAARSEPELADLLARLHDTRRRNLGTLVDALDTVWALTSPELHQLLVRVRRWKRRRYADWLAATLAQVLLPPA
jgi:AcrR family transcriptional regulator